MASNSDFKKGPGTVGEEASAIGQRIKGAVKTGAGQLTGNEQLEREGRIEKAAGNIRQSTNDVIDPVRQDNLGSSSSYGNRDNLSGASVAGSYPANQNPGNSTFDRTSASGAMGVNSGATSNEYRTTGYSSTSSRDLGTASTSSFKQGRLVTGVFHDRHEAEKAWNHLKTHFGFSDNEISIVMSDNTRARHFGDVKAGDEFKREGKDTKAVEGIGVGSALGGTLGAIVGAIAAIGTNFIIPGAGLVLAGPIAAAFAGAGVGGAAGGLIGGLVGAGIPEERAREYDQAIRSGGIVLGVHARDDRQASEIESYLRSHGAEATRR